jgi:hypothetical protein
MSATRLPGATYTRVDTEDDAPVTLCVARTLTSYCTPGNNDEGESRNFDGSLEIDVKPETTSDEAEEPKALIVHIKSRLA